MSTLPCNTIISVIIPDESASKVDEAVEIAALLLEGRQWHIAGRVIFSNDLPNVRTYPPRYASESSENHNVSHELDCHFWAGKHRRSLIIKCTFYVQWRKRNKCSSSTAWATYDSVRRVIYLCLISLVTAIKRTTFMSFISHLRSLRFGYKVQQQRRNIFPSYGCAHDEVHNPYSLLFS